MIQQPHFYSKELKSVSWRDSCIPMFITTLFTITRTRKQPKCPLKDEWIRKMWTYHIYTHTVNNEILFNLEKGRQSHHLWQLNDTKWNKPTTGQVPCDTTYIKLTEAENRIMVAHGSGKRQGGITQRAQNFHCVRWISSRDLLYSTECRVNSTLH